MPAPPYSGGKTIPSRPSWPSSLTVASGKTPASSHFMTLGAISRSANSRTLFFSCSCSSLSWKSKMPSPFRLPFPPAEHFGLEHSNFGRKSYYQKVAYALGGEPLLHGVGYVSQERNQPTRGHRSGGGARGCRKVRLYRKEQVGKAGETLLATSPAAVTPSAVKDLSEGPASQALIWHCPGRK